MTNSLKCMMFSLIGYVVFLIIGFFIPIVTIVSSTFALFAAISLIVFLFKKIHTRHHFLKSSIGFSIFSVFCFIVITLNNLFIKNPDYLLKGFEEILSYLGILSSVFFGSSLIILLLDFGLGTIKLTKERDILPIKIFRLGVYWTYIVGGLGAVSIFPITEINVIGQLLTILMYVFNIITISIIFKSCTNCKSQVKLILTNIVILFLSIVLLVYLKNIDVLTHYFSIQKFSIEKICKYICHFWTLLLIAQFMASMVIYIFKRKKSIFSCFIPIIYAALGLISSGIIYYNNAFNPYRIESLNFIYYYIIIAFAIGVGVSFMSATYKMIFTKTEKVEIEQINLDDI